MKGIEKERNPSKQASTPFLSWRRGRLRMEKNGERRKREAMMGFKKILGRLVQGSVNADRNWVVGQCRPAWR
jgi:hypothetical protein